MIFPASQFNPARCIAAVALAAALTITVGCGAFRARSPVDASLLKCRQYSCEGVTALERGDCQQAEQLLRQAVKASPKDADARRHLAEVLWTRGEQGEAIRNLREAVQLEPHHATTVCRLGQLEAAVGEWQLALRRAQLALQDDPRLASAWALRARANRETGNPDQARADFFRALEYAPNDRETLADLAKLYAQQDKPQRWLATVHRLQETFPHGEAPVETVVMEADAYAALGRPAEAAEGLRLASTHSAPNSALLFRLAQAEAALGKNNAAITAARRALVADQGHLPSKQLIAQLSSQTAPLR